MVSQMWRNRVEREERRQRDRDRAVALAQQTANWIAARDQALRAVGLRVENEHVNGMARIPVNDDVQIHVQFNNTPADRAIRELERAVNQVEGQLRLGGGGVIMIQHGPRREPDAAAREKHEKAKARAKATLYEFLNEEQRKTFTEMHWFEVTGSEGNRYRIRTDIGPSGNVSWRRPNPHSGLSAIYSEGGKFCAYPRGRTPNGYLPREDQYLGQALQLITDENSYLDKANLFGGTYPPTHPHHARYARMYTQAAGGVPGNCRCDTCRELVNVPDRVTNVQIRTGFPGEGGIRW
jgi:hypothetical protein